MSEEPRPPSPLGSGDETPQPTRGKALNSAKWSIFAVLGRQLPQMVAALVLARIMGPETYGVVSAATIYVTLTTLLLDQGLGVSLVQRPQIDPRLPGAVSTVNLTAALLLAGVTAATAPAMAAFFGAPQLEPLLVTLGCGLILKAVAITPRSLLQRHLRFREIGVSDAAAGVLGAAAGITAAVLGADVWSMIWLTFSTDLIVASTLCVYARAGLPNLQMRLVREVLPFSIRIFGSNALAYMSRNVDNVLVGRFLGVTSLSLYAMSYRILAVPVQFIGQTVNRVAFPLFSRLAGDRERLAAGLLQSTELLAFASVLPMAAAAIAAPQLIQTVLGTEWLGAAPILSVLSIAGARETIFNITGPLMRSTGDGKLILRYEWLAAAVQLGGIVAGLQFGAVGVAVGLTTAGFALSPVLLAIQHRITGVTVGRQLLSMLAPVHAAGWGCVAYSAVGWMLPAGVHLRLVLGLCAYLLFAVGVLALCHRARTRRVLATAREMLFRRKS